MSFSRLRFFTAGAVFLTATSFSVYAQATRADARRARQPSASVSPAQSPREEESFTPRSTNGIAAVVNGRPILQSEVQEAHKMQEMQLRATIGDRKELEAKLAELEKKTLDALVEQQLILKEFEPYEATFGEKINAYTDERIKKHFIMGMFKGDRAKFLRELKESGLSYKKFYEKQRQAVIVEMMRAQNAKTSGFVTSDEKEAYLRKNGELFREPDQIKLWSITIPKIGDAPGAGPAQQLALAKEIRAKLVNGADFATMARAYSADSRAGNGGDWGFITKKSLTQRMADRVFSLPDRKISEVVEFDDSYYIFYIEARQLGKMKPREEIDAKLEQLVLMEKRAKASEEWINRLKSKATIRYYNQSAVSRQPAAGR